MSPRSPSPASDVVLRGATGAGFLRSAILDTECPRDFQEDLLGASLRVANLLVKEDYCSTADLQSVLSVVLNVAESQLRHESGDDLRAAASLLNQKAHLFPLLANARDRMEKRLVYLAGTSGLSRVDDLYMVGDPVVGNPLLSLADSSVAGAQPLPQGALYWYAGKLLSAQGTTKNIKNHSGDREKLTLDSFAERSRFIVNLWEKLHPLVMELGFDPRFIKIDNDSQEIADHFLVRPFLLYRLASHPALKMEASAMATAWRKLSETPWSIRKVMMVFSEFGEAEARFLLEGSKLFESVPDDSDTPMSPRRMDDFDWDAVLYGKPISMIESVDRIFAVSGEPLCRLTLCAAWGLQERVSRWSTEQVIQQVLSSDDIPPLLTFIERGQAAVLSITVDGLEGSMSDALVDLHMDRFERAANDAYASILDARTSFESMDERVEMVRDAMMMFDI